MAICYHHGNEIYRNVCDVRGLGEGGISKKDLEVGRAAMRREKGKLVQRKLKYLFI